MAIGELIPIQVEGFRCFLAGATVPAVRQNDTADIPEN